jgi:hypothetical protein
MSDRLRRQAFEQRTANDRSGSGRLNTAPAADEELLEVRNRSTTSGDRVVAVTVDERHASAVRGILAMQAPAIMTEAPLNVA